jgi:hypothetical protein
MDYIKVDYQYINNKRDRDDKLNWILDGHILADKYHANKKQSIKSLNDLLRANKSNGKR